MSPAASSLEYADYPPYPDEWHRLETASYNFNAPARALAREARSRTTAHWPALQRPGAKLDLSYLNGCRALANEVGDAVIEEHLRGDDAAAVESVRDLLHLADLLDEPVPQSLVQPLVSLGIRMIATNRLERITADVALTSDPADAKKLQITTAKELIRQLFDLKDPAGRYADILRRERAGGQLTTAGHDRFVIQVHRGQMESNLAAMSLACHLCYFDRRRWPNTVEEMTAYLPAPPVDAWGPMGYALVKSGRPGGADRPLVYSHCDSTDGLFYPTDEPQYSWYPGFGSGHKQGGQFRDVSLWAPARANPAPTTQPLR